MKKTMASLIFRHIHPSKRLHPILFFWIKVVLSNPNLSDFLVRATKQNPYVVSPSFQWTLWPLECRNYRMPLMTLVGIFLSWSIIMISGVSPQLPETSGWDTSVRKVWIFSCFFPFLIYLCNGQTYICLLPITFADSFHGQSVYFIFT